MVTAASAVASLQAAIELGELQLQNAPGGHPIFAAVEHARDVLEQLEDNAAIMPPLDEKSRTMQTVSQAINAITVAGSNLLTDPDKPLPVTVWPQLKQLPWPWIAAGTAALVLVAVLVQRSRRAA